MKYFIILLILLFSCVKPCIANDETAELIALINQLTMQVNTLTKRIDTLEAEKTQAHDSTPVSMQPPNHTSDMVDLSSDEFVSIISDTSDSSSHVLSNPWWKNIDIWGFGAIGAYNTGSDGTRDEWGFEIKEATLFIEANVWKDIDFFIELQTNRLGSDDSKYVRTGETYIHFRDLPTNNSHLGMKIGRIDIPFGEEYLWQDAIDNPLITNSAAYPYGWDEGILLYGDAGILNWTEQLKWILSVTDGTDKRSHEDHSNKAINIKLYGDVSPDLYLSMSMMHNGKAAKSAIEFGGSHFEPVGNGSKDSVQVSDATFVDSWLFEANAKYLFNVIGQPGYLSLTYGNASQDDDNNQYDRDLSWFSVEPYIQLSPYWYGLLRYSEIGTYDRNMGFHFDGKTFAGGNSDYDWDVKRFRRLGIGLGWTPNPRLKTKFEIGKDWFDLIDNSLKDDANKRHFVGVEVAVGF
jgi:hypothetical protein